MTEDDLEPDERLPCGRSVDALLDQVADGAGAAQDTHQRRCPHCRAALAEYERLWAPVQALTEERPTAPATLVEQALRRLRRALAHTDYGMLISAEGTTLVSARVVVVAAREAAEHVPGVRVALSRPDPADAPGEADPAVPPWAPAKIEAGVVGRTAALTITLAADFGTDLVALGDRVRRAVIEDVRELTGLTPAQVTVVIDDVLT
ncbi:Asp23/Gls24 family envelope stress response protein [Pseudonocardia oroxyli]|uniref:Asp23 family, cell envelope-related function n=1 Tax=Pseudonocardia oroxyli TaxID=366584 RepID=A0A1G7PY50_PSEOR|nr:Asp23/Gls24 family envelope stress response protein [Pseudonocardia oroxyli]SDF90300.1 hypothetical protein SAMN05216377_107251 [Pseudonocardia oroxyli]